MYGWLGENPRKHAFSCAEIRQRCRRAIATLQMDDKCRLHRHTWPPMFAISFLQPWIRRFAFRGLQTVASVVWMALLIVGGGGMARTWSERQGLAQLAEVATERLGLYASALEAELGRFAYLPSLIAIDADVAALLDDADNPVQRTRADRALARINVRAGAILVQVVSDRGDVLATSDRSAAAARIEQVTPALPSSDDISDFFAANPLDGTTDYYFMHPVRRAGGLAARIVVKISLAPLEATWVDLGVRTRSERLLLVDENGVIVMCSVPQWKYRTLGRDAAAPVRATGRYAYAQMPLQPLRMQSQARAQPGLSLVSVVDPPDDGPRRRLAQEHAIARLAARLVALSDPSEVERNARQAAWGGAAAGAAIGLLVLYMMQRRRALRQSVAARGQLQHAHDHLEREVDERTSQLRAANEELKRQIAQRLRAEDELLQAGKMAALGQMSAGISHEINQPLTALRALSRNAIVLLDGGRTDAASDNLRAIDEMAERMGRIITQLKSFARKGGPSAGAVDLNAAVRGTLLLLDHRIRAERVEVSVDLPPGVRVRADEIRLEQVLVNLIGNAIDAMAQAHERLLRIEARAQTDGGRLVVAVIDTGHGVDDEAMAHLLEPFFTTKPAGQGLGLGLVISSKILHDFGGTLRAIRLPVGMRFEFDLERVEDMNV